MRALFGLALPKCVERLSLLPLFYFWFLFVFIEILLEFPIFGVLNFLSFLAFYWSSFSEVQTETNLQEQERRSKLLFLALQSSQLQVQAMSI